MDLSAFQFTNTDRVPCILNSASAGNSPTYIQLLPRPLQLRSEVLVKCYSVRPPPSAKPGSRVLSASPRQLIFSCQFHTCVIIDNRMQFARCDLDEGQGQGATGRLADNARMELEFSQTPESIARKLDNTRCVIR